MKSILRNVTELSPMTKDQIKHIKKILRDQDLSVSELAKRVGCKPPYISLTIYGKRRNVHIQEAIVREWFEAPRSSSRGGLNLSGEGTP